METFKTPKVFQARPGPLKKRIFLGAGLAGVVAIAIAVLARNQFEYTPHFFACGLTAIIFSLRFYFMQVMHGPAALTFDEQGVTMADKASRKHIAWNELESIRYQIHGGHHWRIRSRNGHQELDFYLDGLPTREQESLREVISALQIPNVHIVPIYNPFDRAA